MPEGLPPGAGDAPLQLGSYFVRIVTPSGKVGYVPDDTISAPTTAGSVSSKALPAGRSPATFMFTLDR
jgi:hypothetical protein